MNRPLLSQVYKGVLPCNTNLYILATQTKQANYQNVHNDVSHNEMSTHSNV